MGKKSKKVATEGTTEKKKRNRKPILETMLKSVIRARKVLASIDARGHKAEATIEKVDARLEKWGKLSGDIDSESTIEQLIAEGFVPPKSTGRAPKAPQFVNGATVRIKDEFAAKYGSVYSEVELHSMTYDFFDEVNRVAMCPTSERTIPVKPKHLEART